MINENSKIIGIEVKKLFNTKNYIIDFNYNPAVTIIYGLNGTGKTTILRMIHNLLSLNFIDLESNNFESLILKLKNNTSVEYVKKNTIEQSEIIKKKKNYQTRWKPYSLEARKIVGRYYRKRPIDYFSIYNYFIDNNFSEIFTQMFNQEKDDEVIDTLYELNKTNNQFRLITKNLPFPAIFELVELFFKKKNILIPDWFNEIIHSNPLLYIKSERLVEYKKLREPEISRFRSEPSKEEIIRVISMYSKKLQNLKEKYIQSFNEISQTLNRTFPKRVVEMLKTPNEELPTTSELENQIDDIRKKEEELISFGLLTKKEQEIAEINVESLKSPEIAKSISLWIKDTNEKHLLFDNLLEKLKLFKIIINNHLSEKEIKFDTDKGYYFLTKPHKQLSDEQLFSGEQLSGEQLSSGEQHIVVLSYQIIFLSKVNSLVLIDEPEISLHSTWQNNFIDDIVNMGKNKSLTFIIATHSNEIINGRFSLIRRLE